MQFTREWQKQDVSARSIHVGCFENIETVISSGPNRANELRRSVTHAGAVGGLVIVGGGAVGGYLRMPMDLLDVALPLVHENQLRGNVRDLRRNCKRQQLCNA